jgi:hypothetical protein
MAISYLITLSKLGLEIAWILHFYDIDYHILRLIQNHYELEVKVIRALADYKKHSPS